MPHVPPSGSATATPLFLENLSKQGLLVIAAYMVHFIKKFMFRDHSTIMITSYYEKYYGVITITSYYETYYDVITIRYILSLLYQGMLGLSPRNPLGNLPKFIPLLIARMLLNIYASRTKHFKLQQNSVYTLL